MTDSDALRTKLLAAADGARGDVDKAFREYGAQSLAASLPSGWFPYRASIAARLLLRVHDSRRYRRGRESWRKS